MNRSAKWLVLLLAMTVCLTALWGCGEKDNETLPDDTDNTTILNGPDLPPESSDGMEFFNGSVVLRLMRNEKDQWVWKDDASFPLDQAYAVEMLTTVQEILQLKPIEGAGDPSEYGLSSTVKYMKLTGKEGQMAIYYLGNLTDNGQYYLRRADDETNQIYLAPPALAECMNRSIYDMAILPHLSAMPVNNIKSITVASHAEPQVSKKLVNDGNGNWSYDSTNVTAKIQPLLLALENLQLSSCVDYRPTAGSTALCGLDPALMCIEVEYVNTMGADASFKMHIGTARTNGYHAMITNDTTIYAVGEDIATAVSQMLH